MRCQANQGHTVLADRLSFHLPKIIFSRPTLRGIRHNNRDFATHSITVSRVVVKQNITPCSHLLVSFIFQRWNECNVSILFVSHRRTTCLPCAVVPRSFIKVGQFVCSYFKRKSDLKKKAQHSVRLCQWLNCSCSMNILWRSNLRSHARVCVSVLLLYDISSNVISRAKLGAILIRYSVKTPLTFRPWSGRLDWRY